MLPGGISDLRAKPEAEGNRVVRRSKRFYVMTFEQHLVSFSR